MEFILAGEAPKCPSIRAYGLNICLTTIWLLAISVYHKCIYGSSSSSSSSFISTQNKIHFKIEGDPN